MISSRNQRRLIALAKKIVEKKADCYETRGVCCRWLKIAESWGVKFTEHSFEYLRQVFQYQRRGWRLNLGPYCFGMFKVVISENHVLYGYITQVATIFSSIKFRSYVEKRKKHVENVKTLQKIKKIIIQKLGVIPNDLHEDNYGFLNGKIVITDWGFDG